MQAFISDEMDMNSINSLQAAGEALYTNDIPAFPGELHAEFVITSKGNAKIQNIDPSKALVCIAF